MARRLELLGGHVTVTARSAEQRANARCAGHHAAALQALETILPAFDTVINTIPAMVLPRTLLQKLPPEALIIDLGQPARRNGFCGGGRAGHPRGTRAGSARKCAPRTAGTLIAQTVLAILEERGSLHDEQ